MSPPRPTQGLPAFQGEFDTVEADPEIAKSEKSGNVAWMGGTLPFIPVEGGLPPVDLPARLKQLIQNSWKSARPSKTQSRSKLKIGDRTPHSWKPADIMAHKKLVEDSTYHKAVQPLTPFADRRAELAPHLAGVAADWKTHETLQRVSAYTFRGDKRNPAAIFAAKGFNPPISRTDQFYIDEVIYPEFKGYLERRFNKTITRADFDRAYNQTITVESDRKLIHNYFVWRALLEDESYHAGRMLAKETLKGYISTSRACTVAKGYAKPDGWVYVTRVLGGFLIPDQGKHEWTTIFGEQEIATLGSIPFHEIFAFRQIAGDMRCRFTGPIYLRRNLRIRNPVAFKEIYELLSGRVQN